MIDTEKQYMLLEIIKNIEYNMNKLSLTLTKAHFVKRRAIKSRVITIKLSKVFKSFRKLSLEMGLK